MYHVFSYECKFYYLQRADQEKVTLTIVDLLILVVIILLIFVPSLLLLLLSTYSSPLFDSIRLERLCAETDP